jgi:hypothetical protein
MYIYIYRSPFSKISTSKIAVTARLQPLRITTSSNMSPESTGASNSASGALLEAKQILLRLSSWRVLVAKLMILYTISQFSIGT